MADASDVADKFMMMAERVIRQRDALVKAMQDIIQKSTDPIAVKIAVEAMKALRASVGQQREPS